MVIDGDSHLLQNPNTVPLISIVPIRPPVFQTLIDQGVDVFQTGSVVEVQSEALTELSDGVAGTATEARQVLIAQLQHFYQQYDFVAVLSQ